MKHEENVDVRRVSRVAKIDTRMKVIQLNKIDQVGIKTWGRIDYLCNVHGYRIVKSGVVATDIVDTDVKKHNREMKKEAKASKANNNMAKKKK